MSFVVCHRQRIVREEPIKTFYFCFYRSVKVLQCVISSPDIATSFKILCIQICNHKITPFLLEYIVCKNVISGLYNSIVVNSGIFGHTEHSFHKLSKIKQTCLRNFDSKCVSCLFRSANLDSNISYVILGLVLYYFDLINYTCLSTCNVSFNCTQILSKCPVVCLNVTWDHCNNLRF